MPFVVPNMHYLQNFTAKFVKNVIRKLPQVRATKATISEVESARINCRLTDDGTDLSEKPAPQTKRNCIVIPERVDEIPLDQRVVFYFHEDRSRSTAAQNSSAETD